MTDTSRTVTLRDSRTRPIWTALFGPLAIWFLILTYRTHDFASSLGSVMGCAVVSYTVAYLWKGRRKDWVGFSKVFFWVSLVFPLVRLR